MSSTNSHAGARLRRAPESVRNDAGLVIELGEAYGTALDDWQRDALTVGCGVGEDGLWSAPTVGINISRQNGKSVIAVLRALAGPLIFGEKVVVLSAHQQKTSRLLFQAVESHFANYDDLRKRVRNITAALGREEINLKDGSLIVFPARTRATLRGWSVDAYIADEAQLLTGEQWQSARPAMAARRGSQVWLCGTAPQQLGDGEIFGRLRQAALAGTDDALAWLEFGADPGCDLDDREQWAKANPGRVQVENIVNERRELSDTAFATERLNIWPSRQAEAVFDLAGWRALAADRRGREHLPKVAAYGLDRSPDGLVVIVAAYRDADRIHVEPVFVVDGEDTAGAAAWLKDNAGRRPIVVDAVGPASPAIPVLQSARRDVKVVHSTEAATAAMGFADAVAAGTLTHADTGHGDLARAIASARRRPIGPSGGYGWDRSDAPVAPLVAASLAHYGAVLYGRRGTGKALRVVVLS
jgi:hypothetical protein